VILHGDRGRTYQHYYSTHTVSIKSELNCESPTNIKEENEESSISTPIKPFRMNSSSQVWFPSSLKIYEVSPQLDRNNPSIPSSSSSSTSKIKVNYAAGVHHPKYMLIITEAGLHVIITTANFTSGRNIDGSWIQFFPKITDFDSNIDIDELDNSDFGVVLMDLLMKQSLQINPFSHSSESDFDVLNWIKQCTGNQYDFDISYDFTKAKVKLISSVPSRQPLPPLSKADILALYSFYGIDHEKKLPRKCEKCLTEENKLLMDDGAVSYGSLRIKELLLNRNSRWPRSRSDVCLHCFLSVYFSSSFRPLSEKDMVFVQPTSIGQKLSTAFIGK
jgi:hypothetical protein